MDDNSFGCIDEILVAARLQEEQDKGRKLEHETLLLGAALETLQRENRALQRRVVEAEARAEAQAASDGRQRHAAAQLSAQAVAQAEGLKHRAANDRILLEQAERGRHEAEAQLGAAQRHAAAVAAQNADLRQQLSASQRQVRKLESLAPFADACQEQRAGEAALAAELDRANSRVQQLEGRCAALESELHGTAAALAAAQQLVPPVGERRQRRQQQQEEEEEDPSASLSLADLCDLEGANTQFGGCSSPQSTHSDAAWRGGDGGGLPSVRHALQQRRAGQEQQQQRQAAKQREAAAANEAASDKPPPPPQQQLSLVEGLQQQLMEQQRQLTHLQLQQHVAMGGAGGGDGGSGVGSPEQAAAAVEHARRLQGELEKLQRRNMQLQTALAETSLQHARAAASLQKQLQEGQQEGEQLRQQRDDAHSQLSQLQAAAAAMDGEDGGGGGGGGGDAGSGSSCEQLEQLLEYAGRCNSAVEQNAALLQEKKSWLEKLACAEAEVERCRAEAHQLHLQHLQLAPAASGPPADWQQQRQQEEEEELVQRLLEAQAGEAALRSVLHEAREEQVAACKALSSELRRVHALERLRISDMAEVQRLQRRLHEVQHECRQLFKTLAAAQQHVAASGSRGGQLGAAWAGAAAGQQQAGMHDDFRIRARQ